jgi:hypothetical protein
MDGGTVPEQKEARLMVKRMGEREDEYFRFIDEGIEAANNLSGTDDTAERTGQGGNARQPRDSGQ